MRNWLCVFAVVPVALVSLVACGSQAENQTNSAPKAASTQNSALRLVQTIPLPGVEGRFDHFAVDVKRQHLFVAALGNDSVEVLDLRDGKLLRSLKGLQKPTGVAFVPEFNRLFVGNGDGQSCEVFDGDSFALLQSVKGLPDADNVRYDSAAKQIYVGYSDGALAVINAADGRRVCDIKLAGHPESFQLETVGRRIFVNVPSAGYIAVVDRDKRAVIATWPTRGVKANFPLALNEAGHRLFVGCRQPAQVLIFDTTTGQMVNTRNIGGDTDDLFWNAKQARLYVSCGAGEVNVFQPEAIRWTLRATIPTATGARTSYFVPELQRLYVAVPRRGAQGAEIRAYAVADAANSDTATKK